MCSFCSNELEQGTGQTQDETPEETPAHHPPPGFRVSYLSLNQSLCILYATAQETSTYTNLSDEQTVSIQLEYDT
jgi:hypothetical protein